MLHCRQCCLRVEFDTLEWQTNRKIKPRSITYRRVGLDGTLFVNDKSLRSFKDQIKRHTDLVDSRSYGGGELHLIKVQCLILDCDFELDQSKSCILCAVVKIDALSTMLEKFVDVGKRCKRRREMMAWATAGLWAGELLELADFLIKKRSRQYVCKRDQAATFSGVGSTTIPSL